MACNFNGCIKTEGLLKSQAVTYPVTVVISWKLFMIEMLLPQSTSSSDIWPIKLCHFNDFE